MEEIRDVRQKNYNGRNTKTVFYRNYSKLKHFAFSSWYKTFTDFH